MSVALTSCGLPAHCSLFDFLSCSWATRRGSCWRINSKDSIQSWTRSYIFNRSGLSLTQSSELDFVRTMWRCLSQSTQTSMNREELCVCHVCMCHRPPCVLCMCRNSKLGFTKNQEKYLRYTPDDVRLTLQTFFDGGAKWWTSCHVIIIILLHKIMFLIEHTTCLFSPVLPCLQWSLLWSVLHGTAITRQTSTSKHLFVFISLPLCEAPFAGDKDLHAQRVMSLQVLINIQ